MHPNHRHRFWHMMLAATALALSVFIVLGTNYARKGIERIVHMVATNRVEDWTTHLLEKHGSLVRNFGRAPLPDDEVADLRKEAEIYGIDAFRIAPADEPLGRLRMYARNTFQSPHSPRAARLFVNGEEKPNAGHVHVSLPLRADDGALLGHITALVNQRRLHQQLTQAMQNVGLLALAALGIIIAVALYLFRSVQKDAMHHICQARENDEVTGLPNEQVFEQFCDSLTGASAGQEKAYACIVFGLDDIGRITCAEGHEATGHMLRTMAGRFARLAHEHGARIFRLQRNDFAIMLPVPAPGRHEARMFADKLIKEAHRPVYWQGKSLPSSISVGITFYPEQATSRSELARQATLMREAAREAGGNTLRIYDAGMDRDYNALARMERLLRKAARNCASYFTLHFQPIVRLDDETLYGFEVLLRMHDDNGEPISPVVFIPLAERLKLMDEIGSFVLSEACSIASEWPEHLRVAVNLSPLQFESGRLPSAVWKALETSGLAPSRLELEVTENIVMRDWDKVHEQLDRVRSRGVSLVLDDFGTGYSSMSYLWKFNFDKIKIDRTFTQAVSGSEEARSILRSLIVMARSLKLPLVVEGVEKPEQAAFLRKFRCDYAQGWHYGKPMPAHEVPTIILKDWQRRQEMEQTAYRTAGTNALSA